jgi:hypothetical protein
MRQKAVIPQKGIVEGTTNQVVQINDPNEVASEAVDYRKAPM